MNRQFTEEDIQMANQYMKRCSASLSIKEMQIKMAIRYHYTTIMTARIRVTTLNADNDTKKPDHSYIFGSDVK